MRNLRVTGERFDRRWSVARTWARTVVKAANTPSNWTFHGSRYQESSSPFWAKLWIWRRCQWSLSYICSGLIKSWQRFSLPRKSGKPNSNYYISQTQFCVPSLPCPYIIQALQLAFDLNPSIQVRCCESEVCIKNRGRYFPSIWGHVVHFHNDNKQILTAWGTQSKIGD